MGRRLRTEFYNTTEEKKLRIDDFCSVKQGRCFDYVNTSSKLSVGVAGAGEKSTGIRR